MPRGLKIDVYFPHDTNIVTRSAFSLNNLFLHETSQDRHFGMRTCSNCVFPHAVLGRPGFHLSRLHCSSRCWVLRFQPVHACLKRRFTMVLDFKILSTNTCISLPISCEHRCLLMFFVLRLVISTFHSTPKFFIDIIPTRPSRREPM